MPIMICYVPCSCGEKYYPLGLKKAHELASHEYQTNHAAYRPLTPDETIDDEVTADFSHIAIKDSGPSGSGTEHVKTDSGGADELARDQSTTKTRAGDRSWSEWVWQPDRNRYFRSRWGEFGELEYDFDYTQPWSDWVWDKDNNNYYRTRLRDSGDYDYEYDYDTPGPTSVQERGKGKEKVDSGGSKDDTRPWSDWVWDKDNNNYYRTRLRDSGDYEYEFDNNTPGPTSAKVEGKGKESRKGKGEVKGKGK
ncbi:hypothetical protein G7Y89_g2723 [Cudoniella acicularis]|uniref:Uncharacterized protein n=1 Tax=Cudoniella acicularis TaxID=354080 RepID=A0A8H4RSS1_9HELO|nr:hypothetical protein G7Y89_g2723 [Cudoniella acicularis]